MSEAIYTYPSPCYVIDEGLLKQNLAVLEMVKQRSGCKILLAQKAFSMFSMYPLISRILDGTTASSLHEAMLGHQAFGKETHIYSPAYREDEFAAILDHANHIVFNSLSQWKRYGGRALKANISCGIRLNPEHSTQNHQELYDPCAPFSRFGITEKDFNPDDFNGIEGMHFHTLCQQDADALVATLHVFEAKFSAQLHQMKWLNLGGGHHITRAGYDIDALVNTIIRLRETYHIEVYLEPGEAVVLNTGFLVCEVLDIIENGMKIAILDTSATCHMPDVLEMPYRPEIIGAALPESAHHVYRLGGSTCLAGDVIGDYGFDHPLHVGERLVFTDMALYTMVKTTTFNGINLPAICIRHDDDSLEVVRQFTYEDFKSRLS